MKKKSGITFPESDVYFEKSSADGYAFFGIYKALSGLKYSDCIAAIVERNATLNSEQTINATNIVVPKDACYVYTAWICYEFAHLVHDSSLMKLMVERIAGIGRYPSGMQKYCNHEIEYVVPNVTSAAALVYAMEGMQMEAQELIRVLVEKQRLDGNWDYCIIRDGKEELINRQEDSYHLAMIVYHLRKIERYVDFNLHLTLKKALACVERQNHNRIQRGSIGWGPPMIFVATKGKKLLTSIRAYLAMRNEFRKNHNFRVRAIICWAHFQKY
jgi:hypothetical protein